MSSYNKEGSRHNLGIITSLAFFTGAYILSTARIFTGNDFLTSGLTKEQIKTMDEHNLDHRIIDNIRTFVQGFSLFHGEKVIKQIVEVDGPRVNKILDERVSELPKGLIHTH